MFKQNNQPCTRILLSYYADGSVFSTELEKDQIIVNSKNLCIGSNKELALWIAGYKYSLNSAELKKIIEVCLERLAIMGVKLPDNYFDRFKILAEKNDGNE